MKNAIKNIFTLFGEKRLTTVAGAWVFYFLMSVIPLAFLLATAFGVFGINILNDIVSRLPVEFRQAGEAIAQTAQNASGSVTVFFIFTVIFSVTTLFNQMSKDGDFIYGVKAQGKRGIWRRVWAFVALGTLFLVFLGMALLLSFNNVIFSAQSTGVLKLILTILTFLFVILFAYVIIIVLYKYITPVGQKVKELLFGAFIALSIIVLGTIGFIVYLRYFKSYNPLYGSLATVIVFLIWAYILMLGLVTGVIVNMRAYVNGKVADKKTVKKAEKRAIAPLNKGKIGYSK